MAKWSTEAFEELNGLPLVPLRPDQSNFNLIKNGKIMMGSSKVDGIKKRKSKAEKGESFDTARRTLVAKVVAAVAELLLPGATHVTLALNVEHFPLGGAAAKYQPVIVVKLGEASLKAVVFHAMLKFAARVLVIAFYHLRVLLANHCIGYED